MIKRLFAAAVTSVALLAATAVQAVPYVSGSFGFSANPVGPYTSILTNTTYTLGGGVINVNTFSGVGDMAAIALPATLAMGPVINFGDFTTFGWSNAALGTFTPTSVIFSQSTAHPNASVTYDVVGTFTVGTFWDNYNGGTTVLSANQTWSLTQTGSTTSAVSISGTFHSPRLTVPEPGIIALLGLGLAGIGLIRRRNGQRA